VKPPAHKGEAWAQNWLADAYMLGIGLVQAHVKVFSWYHLSTANGFTSPLKNRDIVSKQMTPQQITDAQKLAQECQARQYKVQGM